MPNVLQMAIDAVEERGKTYGSTLKCHQTIADMWTAFKGVPFSAEDVPMMMILLKVARIANNGYHEDSVVDIGGYALNEQMVHEEAVEKKGEMVEYLDKMSTIIDIFDTKSFESDSEFLANNGNVG